MQRFLAAFFEGLRAPLDGFGHMNRHPALWRHALLPILCNLALSAALLAGMLFGTARLFPWLESRFPPGGAWFLLEWLAYAAAVAAMLGLMLAAWLLFQGILCGHFYSRLAREVEIQLGMDPARMREVPLLHQVRDALRNLGLLAAVALGCLLLSLLPLVGAPAAAVLGATFNCFVFGMDTLDYPQALRARDRRAQLAFARRHRGQTLGLGAAVMGLTFLPLLNSVLLTTAACGAVLLYRRLEQGAAQA